MNNLNLIKFFKEFNLIQAAELISGLATIAVFSMDLGVDYSIYEKKVYTNIIFQIIVVLSVGYLMEKDINQALVLFVIWAFIKFSSRFLGRKKTQEKAIEETE